MVMLMVTASVREKEEKGGKESGEPESKLSSLITSGISGSLRTRPQATYALLSGIDSFSLVGYYFFLNFEINDSRLINTSAGGRATRAIISRRDAIVGHETLLRQCS